MHGSAFLPTFTRSLIARQVFGAVSGEKFSVDIDNRVIDCILDHFIFYFFYFYLLIIFYYFINFYILLLLFFLFFVLGIVPYFIYVVTWSRLHTGDFKKEFSVHAKTRSQGITSIRS